jgi:hypothetical protein
MLLIISVMYLEYLLRLRCVNLYFLLSKESEWYSLPKLQRG